jgi:hypothetical protein
MSFCSRLLAVWVVLSFLPFTVAALGHDLSDKPREVVTIDELLADVSDRVPAFGGMFVDEPSDTLYVYMVPGQPGDIAAVDQGLSEVLGAGRPPEHRLATRAAQYSFRQLKTWHDAMTARVLALSGTVFTDINQVRNRLEIGVESPAVASPVEALLTELGIPRAAVDITVTPPQAWPGSSPDGDTPLPLMTEVPDGKTLRDEFRPLVGGLQIEIAVKGLATASICTMGFVATRDKALGLVTNDHCIQEHNQKHLNLNMVYQPTIADKYKVATGSVDPDFFKQEQNPDCPEGRFCRYSDSAFATLSDKSDDPVGFLAKPSSGSQWDGSAKYRVVSITKPVAEMAVTRVSSQSGIDTGKVSNACRNINAKDSKGRDTGTTFLCQISVAWATKVVSGDSGSPVFTTNKENNDVALLGILWGETGVSAIEQVKITGTELGPTLAVCADGFKC